MSVDAGSEPRVHADPSHLHPTSPGKKHEGITGLLGHGQEVEIHELDKSGNITKRWLHTPGNEIIPVLAKNRSNNFIFRSMREWRKFLSDAFLPVGFPHSVSEDYLAYQTYDSLQAFFSTITSLLANRALLQGLGVGDANSSATFALFLTILKDAMSRVATIVFAQQFGLRIEPDAKKFRFLADVFNDTAFFLELYSPYFGSWGKIVALTTGEALRALCGVSAGASKAALSVHFAKHDNLAELNAKEASQETAVGLIGLLAGTLLVKHVESHQSVVYLMIALVFAHLWMNYLGVRSVCMTNLNRQRATILFGEYLETGKVLTPTEVARRENIIFWSSVARNQDGHCVAHIEMAESYSDAMGGRDSRINIAIVDGGMHTQFIWCHNNTRLTPIKILLWQGAEPANAIEAWFMAQETAWLMKKGLGYTGQIDRILCAEKSRFNAWKNDITVDDGRDVRMYEKRFCDPDLWEGMLAKGWNLDLQAFETGAPVRLTAHFRAKKDD
ncbi:vitamin B6 photo-protection and homoeostasis-domain-containing protein [Dactylonectria macrodidyma]|uniref:Vitamin B6 photo-protection and homoeostasis-domain-containing protein n=1 Tax=Dactylonectria macrodidyma TaxID=307937 RepID=A0A9P9EYL0_9HYPO|nr:vitamin B6 photo-protection and homoeostasis-domain-containing protein [Dactylonectria macrodidyma]